jgi:hypothetical protein
MSATSKLKTKVIPQMSAAAYTKATHPLAICLEGVVAKRIFQGAEITWKKVSQAETLSTTIDSSMDGVN